MNNRAQQVRNKRLKERADMAEREANHKFEVDAKAERLFHWVLDLFEKPTRYNTADQVFLSESYHGSTWLCNNGCNKDFENIPFDPEVMQRLAQMFEEEAGYTGKYIPAENPDNCNKVIIKIE